MPPEEGTRERDERREDEETPDVDRFDLDRRPGPDHVRCSYCHEPDPDKECAVCPRCEAAMHAECWAEAGRCTTLGCPFVPSEADLRREASRVVEDDDDDEDEVGSDPVRTSTHERESPAIRIALFFLFAAFVLYLFTGRSGHEVLISIPVPGSGG